MDSPVQRSPSGLFFQSSPNIMLASRVVHTASIEEKLKEARVLFEQGMQYFLPSSASASANNNNDTDNTIANNNNNNTKPDYAEAMKCWKKAQTWLQQEQLQARDILSYLFIYYSFTLFAIIAIAMEPFSP